MTIGKRFEADIKASVPENTLFYRFKDSPNFGGSNAGEFSRFTPSNVCDCFIFKAPYLYLLELKTTQGKTYSLNDRAFKQLDRFKKLGDFENTVKAFIINFRELEKTYFITTYQLESFLMRTGKKSIKAVECDEIGILISQKKLRTNYRYEIEDIFNLNKEHQVLKLFKENYQ
jgi:recombination protein U